MARPPITAKFEGLFRKQLNSALDYVEGLAGGSPTWGAITGTLADQTDLDTALDGKAAVSHTHTASQVTDLATTVQAYTLDTFANPVASMDFAQQQTLQFVIENRTSDPGAPVSGQVWLRTDL